MEDDPDSDNDSIGDRFISDRRANDQRLKSRFEHIFRKYERDFAGIGDEIDLYTGEIIVNNGHIESMQHEVDPGQVAASTFIDSLAHDYAAPATEDTPEAQDADGDSTFRESLLNLGNEIDRLDSASVRDSGDSEDDQGDTDPIHAHHGQHAPGRTAPMHASVIRAMQTNDTASTDADDDESDYGEPRALPSQIKVLQSIPSVFKDSILAMRSESGPFDKESLDRLEHNLAAQVAQFLATSNPAIYDDQQPHGAPESVWTYPELPPRKRQRVENHTFTRPSLSSSAALFTKSPGDRGSVWAPNPNNRRWTAFDSLRKSRPIDRGDNENEEGALLPGDGFTDAQARFISVVRDHATPAPQASSHLSGLSQSDSLLTGTSLYAANTARRILPKQHGTGYSENQEVPPKPFEIVYYIPKQMRKHVKPPSPRAGVMLQWQKARHLQADVPPALAPKVLPTAKKPVQPQAIQPGVPVQTPFSNSDHIQALQNKYVRKLAQQRYQINDQASAANAAPNLRRVMFTEEEDLLLVNLRYNQKLEWHEIEQRMPGRPADSIANRYAYIRRTIIPDILEPHLHFKHPNKRLAPLPEPIIPPPMISERGERLRSILIAAQEREAAEARNRQKANPPIEVVPQESAAVPEELVEPPGVLPDSLALPYEFTEDDDRAIKLLRERRTMLFDDIAQCFPDTNDAAIGYRYYTHIIGRTFPPQTKESKAAVEKIIARPSLKRRLRAPRGKYCSPSEVAQWSMTPAIPAPNTATNKGTTTSSAQPSRSQFQVINHPEIPNSTASQHDWNASQVPVQGPWIWQPSQPSQSKAPSKHDSVLDDVHEVSENVDDYEVTGSEDILALSRAISTPASSPPLPETRYGTPGQSQQQSMPSYLQSILNTDVAQEIANSPMPVMHAARVSYLGPQGFQTEKWNTSRPIQPQVRPLYSSSSLKPVQQNLHPNETSGTHDIQARPPPTRHAPHQNAFGHDHRAYNPQQLRFLQQKPQSILPLSNVRPAEPNLEPREARPLEQRPRTILPLSDVRHADPNLHSWEARPLQPRTRPSGHVSGMRHDEQNLRSHETRPSQAKAGDNQQQQRTRPRPPLVAERRSKSQPLKPPRKRKSVVYSASESSSGSEWDPDSEDDDDDDVIQVEESYEAGFSNEQLNSHNVPAPIEIEPPARDRFLQIAAQMVKSRPPPAERKRETLVCYGSEDEDYSDFAPEVDVVEDSADEKEKDALSKIHGQPIAMEREAGGELRRLGPRVSSSMMMNMMARSDLASLESTPGLNHNGNGRILIPNVSRLPAIDLSTRKTTSTAVPAVSRKIGLSSTVYQGQVGEPKGLPGSSTASLTRAPPEPSISKITSSDNRVDELRSQPDSSTSPAIQATPKLGISNTTLSESATDDVHSRPSVSTSSSTKALPESGTFKTAADKEHFREFRRASTSFSQRAHTSQCLRAVEKVHVQKRQSAPSRLNESHQSIHDLSEDELA